MERPYLSIGEVLELVKHEFPDVSISRIRTLESGGHLDLERTASGYRKFYDADVAYLKTLLRGGVGADSFEAMNSGLVSSREPEPMTRAPVKRSSNEAMRSAIKQLSHDTAASLDSSQVNDTSSSLSESEFFADDSGTDLPPPVLGPDGELPGNPERRHPAALAATRRANASVFGTASPTSAPIPFAGTSSKSRTIVAAAEDLQPEDNSALVALPVVVSPVVGSPDVAASIPAEVPVVVPPLPTPAASFPPNPLTATPTATNLSLDELSKASGVSIETIRDLESLGLLRGQGVFSTVYYDEDSLLTCRLVAEFQTYGVEPRHLRMYKLAADREAAFFEQVVTPQLRRRNPDAREKAIETLGELVRLGEQLRIVALRQVLRAAIDRN